MITIPFTGLLFDLDGTLVNSIPSVTRSWTTWATKKGLEPEYVLSRIHGRPAIESISELLPNASPQEIQDEMIWMEELEATDITGIKPIAGARELLHHLNELNVPWAIVTSGTIPVASARIKAGNLPMPKVLITPECITKGKPNPEPYLKGAEVLGLNIESCICFEDASVGVRSGKAAQAKVIGVLSHGEKEALSEADFVIDCLHEVTITKQDPTELRLTVHRLL
ncbi:HAD-IA family hydrolase [Vibrio sp. CAU 1672]|uniref:HAD-IA family hydrolase n=1 Tax=Vibrio sp. CAU 1672 TaxID=3032594 RepID=UPI0023DBE77B|nr:HAD-IA family hydrolase [Vibrio sp. CAU 1672]MDF2155164.1 HAD-IA family hydrolase [Vibrio sp. CAU 1672]